MTTRPAERPTPERTIKSCATVTIKRVEHLPDELVAALLSHYRLVEPLRLVRS